MMNGHGKSDSPVVPAKPPNKAGRTEREEGRGSRARRGKADTGKGEPGTPRRTEPARRGWREGGRPKGTRASKTRPGHRAGPACPVRWSGYVRQQGGTRSCGSPRSCTTSTTSTRSGRRTSASSGMPHRASTGRRGEHYGEDLEANLQDLSGRLKRGAYRAKPVRRAYIPKADGRQRPLGVPDAGGQDRPAGHGRGAERHLRDGLPRLLVRVPAGAQPAQRAGRAVRRDSLTKKVNWVLDADIRGFFDAIDHEWLVKFVEHRIADRRVVRLIQKWLNAGVLEDGKRTQSEEGTPQGGSHRRCWRTSTCTTCSTSGSSMEEDAGARAT